MKILAALFLFVATCQAQTFVRYTINDWVFSYGSTNTDPPYDIQNNYTNSVSIAVPTNTIFKGTVLITDSARFNDLQAEYPDCAGRFRLVVLSRNYPDASQTPVLGPAVIHLIGSITTQGEPPDPAAAVVLLAEFDPVNVSPAIQGFAVQPANSTAQISLETSTDLKAWQSATNGSYGLTNAARFYRMNLTVTP